MTLFTIFMTVCSLSQVLLAVDQTFQPSNMINGQNDVSKNIISKLAQLKSLPGISYQSRANIEKAEQVLRTSGLSDLSDPSKLIESEIDYLKSLSGISDQSRAAIEKFEQIFKTKGLPEAMKYLLTVRNTIMQDPGIPVERKEKIAQFVYDFTSKGNHGNGTKACGAIIIMISLMSLIFV